MRVLVHLNHGYDRSVMMDFGRNLNKPTVKKLLKDGVDSTIKSLMGYANISGAVRKAEIAAESIKQAEIKADVTIDQHGRGSVCYAA